MKIFADYFIISKNLYLYHRFIQDRRNFQILIDHMFYRYIN